MGTFLCLIYCDIFCALYCGLLCALYCGELCALYCDVFSILCCILCIVMDFIIFWCILCVVMCMNSRCIGPIVSGRMRGWLIFELARTSLSRLHHSTLYCISTCQVSVPDVLPSTPSRCNACICITQEIYNMVVTTRVVTSAATFSVAPLLFHFDSAASNLTTFKRCDNR